MSEKEVAILVTATRQPSEVLKREIWNALRVFRERKYVLLITGGAAGGDYFAEMAGSHLGFIPRRTPYFSLRGKKGGGDRNDFIVGDLDNCRMHNFECYSFAFPDDDSIGTWRCVASLKRAKFEPVIREMGRRSAHR